MSVKARSVGGDIPWKSCQLSLPAVPVDTIPPVVNVAVLWKPELLLLGPHCSYSKVLTWAFLIFREVTF